MSESALSKFFGSLKAHPKGFWFIFWGELAERSSYYGMRAILTLYLTDRLGFKESNAGTSMSLFIAACYLLPLVGGFVADRYLGKYWTIIGFSLPYILGHLILGIESLPFAIVALALLAMGTGVIKPNISTLMGMTYDQQRPGDEALRSDAFGIFYMAINIGAAISQTAMPYIRTQHGYQIAFAFPAALMVLAFGLFAAGKKHYAVEVIERKKTKTPEEKRQQWAVLRRLSGIFGVVTFFWAIFDQSASTWILFGRDHMDLTIGGMTVEPDAVQALNAYFIIILVPVFAVVWRKLDQRGVHMRPTDKMMVGFVLTTLTMIVMSGAGFLSTPEHKVSIAWQAFAYVLLTCAEVCISVVGLELAFTAAPKQMKSFVTACWLLTVFIANLFINAPISQLYDKMSPGVYFGILAAMMIPVMGAFAFLAGRFNRSMHGEEPSASPSVFAVEG